MIDTKQLIASLDELRSSEHRLYAELQRERKTNQELRAKLHALEVQGDQLIAIGEEMRRAQRRTCGPMSTAGELEARLRAEETFDCFLRSSKTRTA
jgi:hypothetical protein